MRLVARIDELERRHGRDDQRQAQIEADAAEVMRRLERLASNFADDRGAAAPDERARWSKAEQVAWSMRFAPELVPGLVDGLKDTLACR